MRWRVVLLARLFLSLGFIVGFTIGNQRRVRDSTAKSIDTLSIEPMIEGGGNYVRWPDEIEKFAGITWPLCFDDDHENKSPCGNVGSGDISYSTTVDHSQPTSRVVNKCLSWFLISPLVAVTDGHPLLFLPLRFACSSPLVSAVVGAATASPTRTVAGHVSYLSA